jgi:cell division inhibitor SulA
MHALTSSDDPAPRADATPEDATGPAPAPTRTSAAERVARAREALRAAEERTGARSLSVVPAAEVATRLGSVDAGRRSTRPTSVPVTTPPAALSPTASPHTPSSHIASSRTAPSPTALSHTALSHTTLSSVVPAPAGPAEQGEPAVPADAPAPLHAVDTIISTERPPLPVPDELLPLLPAGLRRGITVQVDGSTSVLLALLSEASRAGSWAAVVGAPSIGLLAVAQAGIDLSRLVLVPAPGAQAAPALAALLDGMDIVVVGPEVSLLRADRRRLVARARERASVIVSLRPWEGAHMTLAAERTRWSGLGAGSGRLSSRELTVTRTDRAQGITYRHTVTLPFARPASTAPGVVAPAPVAVPLAVPVTAPDTAPVVVPEPITAPAAAVAAAHHDAVQPSFAQVG